MVLIPGLERFPRGGHGNHSSILAWRIPMDRGAWRPQSIRTQRVGHDWVTKHAYMHVPQYSSLTLRYLSVCLPACPNLEICVIRPSLPGVDQSGLVHSLGTHPSIYNPSASRLRFTCWVEEHRWHWLALLKNTLMSFQSFWKSSCCKKKKKRNK